MTREVDIDKVEIFSTPEEVDFLDGERSVEYEIEYIADIMKKKTGVSLFYYIEKELSKMLPNNRIYLCKYRKRLYYARERFDEYKDTLIIKLDLSKYNKKECEERS